MTKMTKPEDEALVQAMVDNCQDDGHAIMEMFQEVLRRSGFDAVADFMTPIHENINIFGLGDEPPPLIIQEVYFVETATGYIIDSDMMLQELNEKINQLGEE